MQSPVLATHGLKYHFGAVKAVDGVDIHVPAGSIYGFLGPNGAGKTTTIRLILGLLKPCQGSVALLGSDLALHRETVLGRVGALVEQPSAYPHLSGWDNLNIIGRMRGLSQDDALKTLHTVRLEAAASRPVKSYSLGMRQRLALAMAIMGRPDVLILDEPTNGLDPAGIREMRSLIRTLPEQWGVTIMLSSHLLSEVEQVATHLGIINHGRMVFQGSTSELHEALVPHGIVAVDNIVQARRLLTDRGVAHETDEDQRLKLPGCTPKRLGDINTLLVNAGVAVCHLSLSEHSLEEQYLTLTEETRS